MFGSRNFGEELLYILITQLSPPYWAVVIYPKSTAQLVNMFLRYPVSLVYRMLYSALEFVPLCANL